MEFLVNYWFLIVAFIAIICVIAFAIVKFYYLPTQAQITKIKEWLVYACMKAEKELGEKTGQLKLRLVYDMFLTKFNWLAKAISFEQFSKMVDESLEKFKHLLESNEALKNIVVEKQEV